jgi:hypothetical protein
MPRPNAPVSLADLAAAGVRLRPYEAVTIVRELAERVVRGEIAGVPSAHVVRLSNTGGVSIEGPVAAGGRPVVRAAQLLDSLLPAAETGSQFRVPGGLKLVIARALGTLDLPPYGSLEALIESLDRFAATDPAAAIANLVNSCVESNVARPQPVEHPAPAASAHVQPFVGARSGDVRASVPREQLTISDIRRARRATGLTLTAVAERSRIPVSLLRQLEWGYVFNWPNGRYGRSQLVRYARAAGLDEQLVLTTVTPLLEEVDNGEAQAAAAESGALVLRPTTSLATVSPAALTTIDTVSGRPPAVHHGRRRSAMALAAAAVFAMLLLPIWWAQSGQPSVPPVQTSPAAAPAVAAATDTVASVATSDARGPSEVRADATPVSQAAHAGGEPPAPAPAPAPAQERAAAPEPAAAPDAAEYKLAADQTFSPSFASVGTAMFYHSEDKSSGSALVRADTNGDGSILRITKIVDDSANNFHVRPSPDGTRIAFDSDREGIRGVYVADADGKHVRRVSGEGFGAVPSWSPDSRMLAFVRAEPDRPRVWNLWTLQLESGEMRQITQFRYGQPWGGSWFPDGRRIAFSHEDQLIVRDLDTGSERVFPTPVKGRLVRTPAVSPDGRRIVFQVQHDGTWLLDLPGGAARKVLEDPTAEEYTWAPDGHRLAYHSRRSGNWGVWIMASR